MKVTALPTQDGLAEAAIVRLTGTDVLTVMVMPLDVAGLPDLQVKPEDKTQVTTSPLVGM